MAASFFAALVLILCDRPRSLAIVVNDF